MTVDHDEIAVAWNSVVFAPAGTRHHARADKGSRLVITLARCTSAAARAAG